MAHDEGVAERLRDVYRDVPNVDERRMFGGVAFMVNGHMSCGVVDESLMVRVGPDRYDAAMKHPHAREMDFTGQPLRGFVFVEPEGFESDDDLATWVTWSLEFVQALPPK